MGTELLLCAGATEQKLCRHDSHEGLGLAAQRAFRLTHKVERTTPEDIDAEALLWLRQAYERDAPKPRARKA